jgi:hypothetical protein
MFINVRDISIERYQHCRVKKLADKSRLCYVTVTALMLVRKL